MCPELFVQNLDLSSYLPFCVKMVPNHRKTPRQLAAATAPLLAPSAVTEGDLVLLWPRTGS